MLSFDTVQNVSQSWQTRVNAMFQGAAVSPAADTPPKSEAAPVGLAALLPDHPLIETPEAGRLRLELKSAAVRLRPTRPAPRPPTSEQPWFAPPHHQRDLNSGAHKALHAAIKSGKRRAVDEFIRILPFRLDDRDELGRTALHIAAEVGDASIVRKLIKGIDGIGADIHARTFFGLTPLHVAAARGRNAIVAQLIAAGADRLALTDFNATALDLADLNRHESVALTLRRLNVRPSRGWALPPRKVEALMQFCQDLGHERAAKSLGLDRQRLDGLLQAPVRLLKT